MLKHPYRRLVADVAADDLDGLILEMTQARYLRVLEILETGEEAETAINVFDIQTVTHIDGELNLHVDGVNTFQRVDHGKRKELELEH